ncbi:hypothetical protein ACI3KT_07335 [Microbacterium sp. ZW T6_19]|uniref:hypothetical protein n=1 Tax=Microbacterium sp. ZW T6_19 TaxID=3378082 RepID=UPI00385266E3
MTALHTRPIPHQAASAHEHAWSVESRHPASEGTVLYVRCGGCGVRRIDVQQHPMAPPTALSRPLTP